MEDTWKQSKSPYEIWPKWLAKDLDATEVWLVGYAAAKTNWTGSAMPLSARADNILAQLLAEPRLKSGGLIFVAHSMGGLLVEQMLRNAERDGASNQSAADFLGRVRRVAFLGTPHRGAILANLMSFSLLSAWVRPSAATKSLLLNDPSLVDLNHWYRRFVEKQKVDNLVLAENVPEKVLGINLPAGIGLVVSQVSADASLPSPPILVDESHRTICAPSSRNSEVYKLVKEFVSRPFDEAPPHSKLNDTVEQIAQRVERIAENSATQVRNLEGIAEQLSCAIAPAIVDARLIDGEVQTQLTRMRHARLFSGFDTHEAARKLSLAMERGGLSQASIAIKRDAIVWCARVLSISYPDEAERMLKNCDDVPHEMEGVVRGLISFGRGSLEDALERFGKMHSLEARGAGFICVQRRRSTAAAIEWMWESCVGLDEIDSDAKFFLIGGALEEGLWSDAYTNAKKIQEQDFTRTPGLLYLVANAMLAQSSPEELRPLIVRQLPIDPHQFPLRSEAENLADRRVAAILYQRLSHQASDLELPIVSAIAADRAIWLDLMDPEKSPAAKAKLSESLCNPIVFLRRLHMAIQFEVPIDLELAEQEVNRQSALSAGRSSEAALGRLALLYRQGSAVEAAAYLEKHKVQLLQHFEEKAVLSLEIEMLARSGRVSMAEERIEELRSKLGASEIDRLTRILSEVGGEDPVRLRRDAFCESNELVDLKALLDACEKAEDWSSLVQFGRICLDRTGELSEVNRLAVGMYNLGELEQCCALLERFEAINSSPLTLLLYVRAKFELGDVRSAFTDVKSLRVMQDSPAARELHLQIIVTSGDWDALQGFVEEEWLKRTDRTAVELMRLGRIAQLIGAARGRELVKLAARSAPNDPGVQIACYQIATSFGWEEEEFVSDWLNRAISNSSEDEGGPVQKFSLQELLDRKPEWDKRQDEITSLLVSGQIPLGAAARLLNQSLTRSTVMAAVSNRQQVDARLRQLIFSFSGARNIRQISVSGEIALEPIALLNLQMLGLLDILFKEVGKVFIPHNLMAWLLEERAGAAFHQPSRIRGAKELLKLVAEKRIKVLEGAASKDDELVSEIGESLAAMFGACQASSSRSGSGAVVRGAPLHKVGSFQNEDADISGFKRFMASSASVIEMLATSGQLTADEASTAMDRLRIVEGRWPGERLPAELRTLYLDDLALIHLQQVGCLDLLHLAGIEVYISLQSCELAEALASYDNLGLEVRRVLDDLRLLLASGIETGKVELLAAVRKERESDQIDISSDPSIAMLNLNRDVRAMVVDDRYINQNSIIATKAGDVPVMTTLDVLASLERTGVLERKRFLAAMAKLRQFNHQFIPVQSGELSELLLDAKIESGVLKESAELRAIRENVSCVKLSAALQLPQEAVWLDGIVRSSIEVIRSFWMSSDLDGGVELRSSWLLDLADPIGWSHRVDETGVQLRERKLRWIELFVSIGMLVDNSARGRYWSWFEQVVLEAAEDADSETRREIIGRVRNQVERFANSVI